VTKVTNVTFRPLRALYLLACLVVGLLVNYGGHPVVAIFVTWLLSATTVE
jgi:hypothetical protein